MSYQFDRKWKLVLSNAEESLTVENLTVAFQLGKTLLGYPARGRIEIFNLGEENIQKITQRYTSVDLYVGYAETGMSLIFRGNITNSGKNRYGPTSTFLLIVKSSTAAWEESSFSRTFVAGTPPATIIQEIVASFKGVIPGQLALSPDWQPALADVTFTGSSRRLMDQLARDYNFDWNIVEGEVLVVARGQALQDKPIYLVTAQTGMIGSPVITELGVDFRVLLNPAIMLGRQVQIKSDFAQLGQAGVDFRRVRSSADGVYKVMDIRMTGNPRSIEWYCDIVSWGTNNATRN